MTSNDYKFLFRNISPHPFPPLPQLNLRGVSLALNLLSALEKSTVLTSDNIYILKKYLLNNSKECRLIHYTDYYGQINWLKEINKVSFNLFVIFYFFQNSYYRKYKNIKMNSGSWVPNVFRLFTISHIS